VSQLPNNLPLFALFALCEDKGYKQFCSLLSIQPHVPITAVLSIRSPAPLKASQNHLALAS